MMNARRMLLYLALNVLVSISATWAALWMWENWLNPRPTAANATQTASATPTQFVPLNLPAPNATPFPTVAPQPREPQVHTVQTGETLGFIAQLYSVNVEDILAANNLADANVLSVGQQLIIPIGGFEPTPVPVTPLVTVPPIATATPPANAPAPNLSIREVRGAGVLENEVAVIANAGGPVNLAGWTLRAENGAAYTFPAITLFEGGIINVRTQSGPDTVIDLYWNQSQAMWASGQLILLADPSGNLIARYTVP
jgi:LysM repeat protein